MPNIEQTEQTQPSPRRRRPRRQGTRQTTLEIAVEIHRLHRSTTLPQHSIASILGINQGIVSMVLNGKMFPEAGYLN